MIHEDPKVLIIRLGRVPFMDITGIQALEEVIDQFKKRGVIVMLCEANARVTGKLERAGILDKVKKHNMFSELSGALLKSAT